MKEPITKTIDGMTFIIGQVPGRRALTLFHHLARTVLPAVSVGAQKLVGENSELAEMDLTVVVGALGEALPRLFKDLSAADLDILTDGLLATVLVSSDGKVGPVLRQFDLIFTGQTFTVLKLLAACVVENYGGFLQDGDLGKLLAELKARKSRTSLPPSETPGQSGA